MTRPSISQALCKRMPLHLARLDLVAGPLSYRSGRTFQHKRARGLHARPEGLGTSFAEYVRRCAKCVRIHSVQATGYR